MRRIYIVSGLAWILVGTVLGALTTKILENRARDAPSENIVVGAPGTAFPGTMPSWQGNGLFQVPQDAPPGTYQVAQGGSNWGCTWSRLEAFDTRISSVEQSGTVLRGQINNVVIREKDKGFRLQGDCLWQIIN